MSLDLTDCQFSGPALPEPFVKFELEKELSKRKLLAKTTGTEGKQLKRDWDVYRRKLRSLAASGGPRRVRDHIIEPLVEHLGYTKLEDTPDVKTREDTESGGVLLVTEDGQAKLRVWATAFDEDLLAPSKRGRAYRFSHLRIAQRVLLTTGERVGLLTNGIDLLLLISDPARPDSTITIPLDAGWKRSRDVPDSFRFLLAITSPDGLEAIPDIVDKARLGQARVTKELRKQARRAVRRFIQEILDHPENRQWFSQQADKEKLARDLWREGLITVYRLLFLLKLESSDDPARSFSFASTSLWRNTFSPSMALAGYARDVLEKGVETGNLLESGLRTLFRMFEQGLECTELVVKPLGGSLFGENVTPTLSQVAWGERAVAHLLDQLLWTTPQSRGKGTQRERVHYGPLDVEDLGRVYEALLELEPGIASEPMCRLKRQKLEVVVPLSQGEQYRPIDESNRDPDEEDDSDEEDTSARSQGKKSKVEWIEEIPPGRFYLRVGLGRKSSGSYYTPHSFVRFLVQETLGPQVTERSPQDDPNPMEILKMKVLDPAMGSGHFLVEACRFLGDALYEACRLCDEKALAGERRAEKVKKSEAEQFLKEAQQWRQRVIDLPDPDDELLKYLPSRSPEGEETGLSQQRAIALCRRLIATHCLYGVDKNPLAVELAKLALWLESHAEGMPLTFLDHRFVLGDSLTGPFWEHLLKRPSKPNESFETGVFRGIENCFKEALFSALRHVRRLEASVGVTVAENEEKDAAKHALDEALLPIRLVSAAWSGGVMLGPEHCDDAAYLELLTHVSRNHEPPEQITLEPLREMIARGLGVQEIPTDRDELFKLMRSNRCIPALAYDLVFPDVFYPNGVPYARQGFHAVLGNPPWDKIKNEMKATVGAFHFPILEMDRKTDWEPIAESVLNRNSAAANAWHTLVESNAGTKRITETLYKLCDESDVEITVTGDKDLFMYFIERGLELLRQNGLTGFVMSGGLIKNPAATESRFIAFSQHELHVLRHFHNRNRLFSDLPGIVEFSLFVSRKSTWRENWDASIGLDLFVYDDLAHKSEDSRYMKLNRATLREVGGELIILSRRNTEGDPNDSSGRSLFDWLEEYGIELGTDLHRTQDDSVYSDLSEILPAAVDARLPETTEQLWKIRYAPLRTSRSIWQFTDIPEQRHPRWDPRVRLIVRVGSKKTLAKAKLSRFYRLALRETCGSPKTNEHSLVVCLLPPAHLAQHKILIEKAPSCRPNAQALAGVGLLNSFVADARIRSMVQTSISKSLLKSAEGPSSTTNLTLFLSHCVLRLTCNHVGYEPLWREQVGDEWREKGENPFSWPVLKGEDERWVVRSAIDAVVADAYKISHEQYEHVLSTFSHASYLKAPEVCLAAFDELQEIGLDAFTKKHDPYHDIPLNEKLPEPVIDLPVPGRDDAEDDGEFRLTGKPKESRGRK